ncbi:Pumilio y domain member 6 [Tieghemiomyces parasiticus]|uniref:Pumilio y domain member 6 n=1 Tax=Tieghemiomyces parasiticus TaxID=78921 RepID=A0A9W7ZSZ9_9FUNG|nr:Pumilio y domain member 6 [Tieghemiomyces parasiticus]
MAPASQRSKPLHPKLGKKPSGTPSDKSKYNNKRKAPSTEEIPAKPVTGADAEPTNKRGPGFRKPKHEVIVQAKALWEDARSSALDAAAQKGVVDKLVGVLEGHIAEMCFKEDGSRILQTCLKNGTPQQRYLIADELKGNYLKMIRQTYPRHLLLKVMIYCPKRRGEIIQEFDQFIPKLITHRDAAEALEEIYVAYATPKQRRQMIQEFYGREFSLFKKKDDSRSLADILAEAPQKREAILRNILDHVTQAVNKGTITFSLLHHAALEYLTQATDAEATRMVDLLKEHVPEILHTKDGSQVAMQVIARANTKERRNIIKALKPYVKKVCDDEYGFLVILAVFDLVDDTVLVNKLIVTEMAKELGDLMASASGRCTLAYLFAGRAHKYLIHDQIQRLASLDTLRAATSKKNPMLREKELRKTLEPHLQAYFTEHVSESLVETYPSQVLVDYLLNAEGDTRPVVAKLAEALAAEPLEDNENHVLNSSVARHALAALVRAEKGDKPLHVTRADRTPVAPQLWRAVQDHIAKLALGEGAYLLSALANHPTCGPDVRQALGAHKKAIKAAASDENKGPLTLLTALSS